MGLALAWHHDGHASQFRRVQLTHGAGIGGVAAGPNDEEVIRSYLKWLHESPETELLRLVGFFHQQKIFLKDLESLIMCDEIRPVLPNLWQCVRADGGGLRWEALYETLWVLEDNMLLLGDVRRARDEDAGEPAHSAFVYDAHPLLRDYYAAEIQGMEGGKYWRAGQKVLFAAYSGKVAEKVASREDALLLYDAIGYACQAGEYQEAFETYWHRIHHNDWTLSNPTWYAWYRLGLYSADLGALGWFYRVPWEQLEEETDKVLTQDHKTMLRLATAECLRTLGLAREAGAPIDSVSKALERRGDALVQMAIVTGWECERRLIQGDFKKARVAGERALKCAERSKDLRQICSKHGRLGDLHMQKGAWKEARFHFEQVLKYHREHLREAAQAEDSPIAGFTGFLHGDFLLTRAEIVLAGWDPEGKYLGRDSAPTPAAARLDVESVIRDVRRLVDSGEQISLYDKALHEFLALRAMGIQNIFATGGRASPTVHGEVNDGLRRLDRDFDQYAHGELPRFLVKRGKVLRRLRQMGTQRTDEDGDLLAAAYRCLDRAADIATYGRMALFEADILLERAKVFLCHGEFPDASSDTNTSIKNSAACIEKSQEIIEQIGYKKRLPELKSAARLVKERRRAGVGGRT
jgi:tetratricopeptide (TPR) repeat protein